MAGKLWTIATAACTVLMAIVAVISFGFGYCGGTLECSSGNVPMHCYYAYQACGAVGIAGVIIAACGFIVRDKNGRRVNAVASIVTAAVALLILFPLVGVCGNAAMSCYSMRTVVAVICALDIVCAVIGLVKADPEEASKPKRGF